MAQQQEQNETYVITHWSGLTEGDTDPNTEEPVEPVVLEIKETKEFIAGIIVSAIASFNDEDGWNDLVKIERKTADGLEAVTLDDYFYPYLTTEHDKDSGEAKVPDDKQGYIVRVGGLWTMYSPTYHLLNGVRYHRHLMDGDNYVDHLVTIFRDVDGNTKENEDGTDKRYTDGIDEIEVDGVVVPGDELYDDWKEDVKYIDDEPLPVAFYPPPIPGLGR
jgi:hypothetical protein